MSFLAVRDYVIEKRGGPAWESCVGYLRSDDREALGEVAPNRWYPLAFYARVVRAVDDALGTGDLATLSAIISYEAERDLPNAYRMLLKLVKPTYVIERMAGLWERYNSSGRLVVQLLGDRAVEGTILDWSADKALCLGTQYYCERALQLSGARGVRMTQPKCRAQGDDVCVIRATWEPRSWGGMLSIPPDR